MTQNSMARAAQPLVFTVADKRCSLRLWSWRPPTNLTYACAVRLTGLGDSHWLAASGWPWPEQLAAYVPVAALDELPPALRNAVLEAAFAPALVLLEQTLNVTLQIVEFTSQAPDLATRLGNVGFTLEAAGSGTIQGVFSAGESLQPLLQQALERWPLAPIERWDWLPVALRFELGSARLAQAEFAQLALGDLILVEQCAVFKDSLIRARIHPGLALVGRIAGDTVVIKRLEEVSVAAESQSIVNIDELPVKLEFDIGERSMSFRELRQLQPGYTFDLERPLERLVTIRGNGQRIGVGELVQIDGRVGVRLLELHGRHDG